MRRSLCALLLAVIVLSPVSTSAALSTLGNSPAGQQADGVEVQAPTVIWPKGAPELKGWPGKASAPVTEELRDDGETLWNVTVPSYQAFLPPPGKATGAAVIIAPGGGFRLLAMRHEGTRVAQWLAEHGIAAFALKYRLIQTLPGETNEAMRKRVNATIPAGVGGDPGVADGLETLRLLRSRAAEYRIDPKRIGVVGFSAGGHVAGMMAFAPEAVRPNFAGLIYGMPFGAKLPEIPPANLPYPEGTPSDPWLQPAPKPAPGCLPPLFLAMAQDDMAVGYGFRPFYDALFASGYRPETHLYERGGHGFGMKQTGGTTDHWLEEFRWWIAGEGFTPGK